MIGGFNTLFKVFNTLKNHVLQKHLLIYEFCNINNNNRKETKKEKQKLEKRIYHKARKTIEYIQVFRRKSKQKRLYAK